MPMKKKSGVGYGMGKGTAGNKMPKTRAQKTATSKKKAGYNARTGRGMK